MLKWTLILALLLITCQSNKLTNLLTGNIQAADECILVNQQCPLTNNTDNKASCHIDKEANNCTDGTCWKMACVYCSAKFLGCETNFEGGVPGKIVGFERLDSYNCQYMTTVEDTGFSVKCSCSGKCSFHSQWRIYYKPFVPPTNEIAQ
jgi:hypothetical protein